MASLRDRGDIESEYRRLSQTVATRPPGYDADVLAELTGVVAALGWALGEVQTAPISVAGPAGSSREALEAEYAVALANTVPNAVPDLTPQRQAAPQQTEDYLFGVKDALAWVLGYASAL